MHMHMRLGQALYRSTLQPVMIVPTINSHVREGDTLLKSGQHLHKLGTQTSPNSPLICLLLWPTIYVPPHSLDMHNWVTPTTGTELYLEHSLLETKTKGFKQDAVLPQEWQVFIIPAHTLCSADSAPTKPETLQGEFAFLCPQWTTSCRAFTERSLSHLRHHDVTIQLWLSEQLRVTICILIQFSKLGEVYCGSAYLVWFSRRCH